MPRILATTLCAVLVLGTGFAEAQAQTLRMGSTGALAGLMQRLVDAFVARSPGYRVELSPSLGSAGAIAAVNAGAIDLAMSGRNINDREMAKGAASMPVLETPYLFVSASLMPLDLKPAEVVAYFAGDTTTYPTGETIRLILRPRTDSATLFLSEAIPGMAAALERARQRQDLPVATSDQDNMQHLSTIKGGFSGMTLAQLVTEPNGLQRVRLNGVEGTLETMASGAYPLRVVMYAVTAKAPGEGARAFLGFMASGEGRAIIDKAGARYIGP